MVYDHVAYRLTRAFVTVIYSEGIVFVVAVILFFVVRGGILVSRPEAHVPYDYLARAYQERRFPWRRHSGALDTDPAARRRLAGDREIGLLDMD